jgi:transcriptional regulator of met regulon
VSLIAFLAGSWRFLALLREAKDRRFVSHSKTKVLQKTEVQQVTEKKIWKGTSRSALQGSEVKPRRCRTTTPRSQGSLWQSGTLPPKWQKTRGFLFSQKELNYWEHCGEQIKSRSQWHYLQTAQQMPCGQGTSQYTRPRWPEHMQCVGKVPHIKHSSMVECWRQGSVPSLLAGMPQCNFCNLCGSSSPPISGKVPSNGQWLPRQCNGCSKELPNGMDNPGMGLSSNSCKQDAEQSAQGGAPVAFHYRLRNHIKWWEQHSSKEVLQLIRAGVTASLPLPPKLSGRPCIRSKEETKMALEALKDYISVGAVKEINPSQAKHLIPWFVIKKGEKLRLITDCREVNHYLEPKPFRLENWKEIFPYLRKGMWAAKIDLKHAYFHLGIAETLKHYICIKVEDKVFQFQGACFGMSTLPQQWQSVMKVFLKKWRNQGLQCWVYLDDILLVANSPQMVQKQLAKMLEDLENSGMVVNQKKSQLMPTQAVEHLGFTIDFKQGCLQVPQEKLKAIRKELGKLVTHSEMSCRKMAAILGATRSFLMAMPFLRAFTDQLVQFVNQQEILGWDQKVPIPYQLQQQVKEMHLIMEQWKGRKFQ